jgi:hypothetical protein
MIGRTQNFGLAEAQMPTVQTLASNMRQAELGHF